MGESGSGNSQFDTPLDIAAAPNGRVYVTDPLNHRVRMFATDGTFLGRWGSQGSGDGQFSFSGPLGIAVAPGGTIYVGEPHNRIQAFCVKLKFPR